MLLCRDSFADRLEKDTSTAVDSIVDAKLIKIKEISVGIVDLKSAFELE